MLKEVRPRCTVTARLLLSENALDCVPYHNSRAEITWVRCSLRSWLNGAFLSDAFNSAQRPLTAQTPVRNAPDAASGTPGPDTDDCVFCLSGTELKRYLTSDGDRACHATGYAKERGALTDSKGRCYWWLRSPGSENGCTGGVYNFGRMAFGFPVSNTNFAVRPALWIRLKNGV